MFVSPEILDVVLSNATGAANFGVGRHERGQRVGFVVRLYHGGLGNQGHGHVACRESGECWFQLTAGYKNEKSMRIMSSGTLACHQTTKGMRRIVDSVSLGL